MHTSFPLVTDFTFVLDVLLFCSLSSHHQFLGRSAVFHVQIDVLLNIPVTRF